MWRSECGAKWFNKQTIKILGFILWFGELNQTMIERMKSRNKKSRKNEKKKYY